MKSTDKSVEHFEMLTLEELIEVRERIDRLIQGRLDAEKRTLMEKLARIERYERAAAASKHTSRSPHIAPKYRDPVSGATWSGRGKLPRWMVRLIEEGAKREDFLIDDSGA